MMAITLWQPYASFMAIGMKKNETRSWPIKFRGDLAICAAKRVPKPFEFGQNVEDLVFFNAEEWGSGYSTGMAGRIDSYVNKYTEGMFSYGTVLCVVEVYDCKATTRPYLEVSAEERTLGNYAEGRYCLLTRNVRRLKQPVPVSGKQGLFFLPPDVEQLVNQQIASRHTKQPS